MSIIQHEAAHHIQASMGLVPCPDKTPQWLLEGLAMLFEVPLDDEGRQREPINGYRLFEFRKLHGNGSDALDNLAKVLSDDAAWCGGKCYPLAWAVTQYLCEQHPTAFSTLLRTLASDSGVPETPTERRALLERLFGPVNKAWIERFRNEALRWPLHLTSFGR